MNEEKVTWSRRGQAIFQWINDCVPGAGTSEISAPSTVIFNIPAGQAVFITQLSASVETVSDDCYFSLIACTGTYGGGTATELAGRLHISTGTALVGTEHVERTYDPPIRVLYSAGYRSVSIRTIANDNACTISAEWQGWYEDEI